MPVPVVRRLLAASALVLPLLVARPAAAGPFTDSCLWRKPVLGVYHAGVDASWRVWRAMRVWNAVHVGQPVLHTVTSKAAADVVVAPYRAYSTDVNGWTLNYCDRDHITRSTVRLNAARPLSDVLRAKVTVHELGHVLSLRHRPNRPHPTVMDAFLRGPAHPTLIDRLTHHADVTLIDGDSYRRRESEAEAAARRKDLRA